MVVETVFALPGLGSWMIESIFARDYMVVQTLTLAFALGVMLINLVTDLIYPLFDPARSRELMSTLAGDIAVAAPARPRVHPGLLAIGGAMLLFLVVAALVGPLAEPVRSVHTRLRPAPAAAERAPIPSAPTTSGATC